MTDFNLADISVSNEVLQKVYDNRQYNHQIIDYYRRFANKGGSVAFASDTLMKKVKRIDNCNKVWYMDYYKEQDIKDFQKTVLCRDKFCANCKKIKQSARMAKYIPQLEVYDKYLYHLTLTVPNCIGEDLRIVVRHMAKCFKMLINYFTGHNKINGVYFDFDFVGAIRSLEVTFSDKSYHPHYHVALALDNFSYSDEDRNIINDFSYNYGKLSRLFHPIEILIQKIWRLLIDKKPVTLSNIESLERGYSCTIDKFVQGNYVELFKYMTKETKEDGTILSYLNFIHLQFGLHRIKQLQGYGEFYNIVDEVDLEEIEKVYDDFINELKRKEAPSVSYDTPLKLLKNTTTIISRKSYFAYLKESLLSDK